MSHQRWLDVLLIIWLCAWAVVYAQLGLRTVPPQGERILNSPDETANYYFANRVAAGLPLAAPALIADDAAGIVHPRAMEIYNGKLVPVSFLGLPVWYGMFGRIAGASLILWLTPALTVISSYAFYRLLRGVFDPTVAWFSAALLAMLSPWWYYSARVMFHNAPFVALTMCALYCLWRVAKHGGNTIGLLGGFALGLALTFRTSEALWLVPLVVVFFIACPGRHRRAWWWVALGGAAAWAPVLLQQSHTFGSPFRFGYLLPSVEGASVGAAVASRSWFDFLPYGLHPRRAWGNTWHFTFQMFPWLFWPALFGFVTVMFSWLRQPRSRQFYVLAFLVVSAFLILYYGSGELSDNLNPRAVTLGMSYVRYWLPIYAAALPFAVMAIRWVARRIGGPWVRRGIGVAAFVAFGGLSAWVTLLEPMEGLAAVERSIASGYQRRAMVSELIQPDAVKAKAIIVAERTDKIFFPTYPVVSTFLDSSVQQAILPLLAKHPVYYYTFLDDRAMAVLQTQLQSSRITLSELTAMETSAGQERLYRLGAANISP